MVKPTTQDSSKPPPWGEYLALKYPPMDARPPSSAHVVSGTRLKPADGALRPAHMAVTPDHA